MLNPRPLNKSELNYWNQFNISPDTLTRFNVLALNEITINKKVYPSSEADPIFCYKINDSCFKIYRPLTIDKSTKFRWIGNKPDDFIFGYTQLPAKGDLVYITGGEKDVLCLADFGLNAITLNSETAIPTKELIENLKKRFNKVIILYDIDSTGINQSKKISELFELYQCMLPKEIVSDNQKDISDFVMSGFLIDELETYITEPKPQHKEKSDLEKILSSKALLKEKKSTTITFSNPLLKRGETPILYPRTINVIQGKSGTHKSRLAQTICSAIINSNERGKNPLELTKDSDINIGVCYVDTERNLMEQFPHGIQQILINAGYQITDNPNHLDYISLLDIKRENRFKALKSYLDHQKSIIDYHTLIVLDVTTDCLLDFNRTDCSMELIDLMNRAIHDNNVTFLCLIHENPGLGEKARGHLGTEIMNKSTNVIQVAFEMINKEPSEIIKIAFLKSRNNKRPAPIYVECNSDLEFEEVPEERILELTEMRQDHPTRKEVELWVSENLKDKLPGSKIDNVLCPKYGVSSKTIRNRLDSLHKQKTRISSDGKTFVLEKDKIGRENHYYLQPYESNNQTEII